MAASEPAPNVHSWTEDAQSSNPAVESLDMGMSGMSLVSTTCTAGPDRKESASSFESKDFEVHAEFQEPPPPPPPLPYAEQSPNETAPQSPGVDKQNISSSKGVSRPPGITVAPLPSPLGKPGHSKNTSATSPLLTLTPNSSVDGNLDWQSMGARMSPPFQTSDVPPLPFLHGTDYRRGGGQSDDGGGSLGSYEFGQDNDNDGLLGLEALVRERAYSSPGPMPMVSTSPPVARGHFPPHAHSSGNSVGTTGSNQQLDAGQMEKPRPRERPPLSYSHQEGSSNHQGDRNAGGMAFMSAPTGPPNRSTSAGADANNVSFESNDSLGIFGAIARPELRQAASDFDLTRRRAASQDNYQNPYALQQQQQQMQQNGIQDPSQKFGSLPTLSNHLQQQRMPENVAELQRPRHVRSVSTPMPNNVGSQQLPAGMDARFYQAAMQLEGHSYSGESKYKQSVSQPALSSSYDANQYTQKRVSMPILGGNQGYGGQPGYLNLARRDGMEYQMNAHGSAASADDIRSYPNAGMISPGHSPMQVHYGSHSRHSTDGGSAMLSASPRSVGGMSRGGGSIGGGSMMYHSGMTGDEDLAHPLVGEHIDVPAEHDDMMYSSNAYVMSQNLPHGMQQQRHTHSLSMDQMLPQFIETPHHLPTAGAALPMPKVVYSVKFKRTQRNFVLGPRISRDLKIGTYVKVEADRGEDLGIVVGKVAAEKYNFPGRTSFSSVGLGPTAGMGGGADLKRIIRLATHDEVSLLSMKRDEEEELLKICRAKVRQRGLPMNVVDAEYQFDRHKLTFFFEAEGRVDFRELVRDLFSMYKTRIWMQQLDKNTSTSSPAIMSPHPSSLMMDYGTPIIAPMSEFADSIVLGGMSVGDARSH